MSRDAAVLDQQGEDEMAAVDAMASQARRDVPTELIASRTDEPGEGADSEQSDIVVFDGFEIDRSRFELRREGRVVALQQQAFNLLTYLADATGRVVSKEELLDNVWGTRFVTEAALTSQIKMVRQALGDDGRAQRYIRTVHRRGYEFVAERVATRPSGAARRSWPGRRVLHEVDPVRGLPVAEHRLVGRSDTVSELLTAINRHVVVSLVGPGGCGKTRLAIELVRRMPNGRGDGVVFVDLSSLSSGDDVPRAVAEVAGLGASVEGMEVADELAGRDTLVVLDNCEHVIDAVADLVSRIVAFPHDRSRVVVTSREPLDIGAELVCRPGPLATVSPHGVSPAAQLFCERAGITADHGEGEVIDDIVVMLDGNPLAIELAAAQLRFMTLHELRGFLGERRIMLSSTSGRRRNRRQQSMASTLEWSWNLLDHDERDALRRLTVFPHTWTLRAAAEVVSLDDPPDPVGIVGRLHAKSLVAATRRPHRTTRYRLHFGVREFVRNASNGTDSTLVLDRLARACCDWSDRWSFEEQWVSNEYADDAMFERENVRRTIEHTLDRTVDTAARLVGASAPLFRYGIGTAQGRAWCAALDRTELGASARARVALAGAEAAYASGDARSASAYAGDAVEATRDEPSLLDVHAAALVARCHGRTLVEPDECVEMLGGARRSAAEVGAHRLEALSLGLLGFARLAADRDVDDALATADAAQALSAAQGWEQYYISTLRGAALVSAGRPLDAGGEFAALASMSRSVRLRAATAVFEMIAAMCVSEDGPDIAFVEAVDTFLREYSTVRGRAGFHDAALALGFRAAVRGDATVARELLGAVRGHRLALQVSSFFLEHALRATGDATDLRELATFTAQPADPRIEGLVRHHLAELR